MDKYRVSTTISSKHYAILTRHAEQYGTHQKVIERAIESLDHSPKKSAPLSREEKLWIRMGRELSTSFSVNRVDIFMIASETVDLDRFREYTRKYKPVEFMIEYIYQKPLKKCTIEELIEGLVLNIKIQKSYDTINYTDEGDYYMLNLTHSLGIGASNMMSVMHDSVFQSYGIRSESFVSERSIFTRIYKKKIEAGKS